MKKLDLTNQKFTRLTVIKKNEEKDKFGKYLWVCLCDCGTLKKLPTGSLASGRTKSCGCLNRERTKERNATKINNLIGEKFGRLTVQEITDKRQGGTVIWRCK